MAVSSLPAMQILVAAGGRNAVSWVKWITRLPVSAHSPRTASAMPAASEGGAAMRMLSNHRGPHRDCMLLLRNCKRALTVSASCRIASLFLAGSTAFIASSQRNVPTIP